MASCLNVRTQQVILEGKASYLKQPCVIPGASRGKCGSSYTKYMYTTFEISKDRFFAYDCPLYRTRSKEDDAYNMTLTAYSNRKITIKHHSIQMRKKCK